jgi:hypothetical protein
MKLKGYVALTTVLVMLPLLLLTGLNTLYNSITDLIIGKMNYDYQILDTALDSCLEETVYRIKWEVDYTGEFVMDMIDYSCTSTVSNKDPILEPGIKIVEIEVTDPINSIERSITKELNSNINPFELKNI